MMTTSSKYEMSEIRFEIYAYWLMYELAKDA